MKVPRYFVFAAAMLLAFLLLLQSCKKDSDNPVGTDQSGTTIGVLTASPNAVLVNNATSVLVRLTVPAAVKLADSTAKIYRLGVSGAQDTLLGLVFDDGLLVHFDDIKGDNVFNNSFSITAPSSGTLSLRATATTNTGVTLSSSTAALAVFSNLTTSEYVAITKTQDSAATKLNQFLAGNPANAAAAVAQLKTWLQSKAEVASLGSSGSSSISILYSSGLYGGLFITQTDANGSVITLGGVAPQERRSRPSIPLSRQTVGTSGQPASRLEKINAVEDLDPTIIGNRNVLIYEPFQAAITPWDLGATVKNDLNNSGFQFEITHLLNSAANIAALSNLTSYGYVVFETHGAGGKEFGTGEVVDTNAAIYKTTYKGLLKAGKLAIWDNIKIGTNGAVAVLARVYVIRYPYIRDLLGTFPNSVIYAGFCEGTMADSLGDAFIAKGAKTYYGYSKVVYSSFCRTNADTVTNRLARDLKTTGDAFMAGSDPNAPNAVFEIKGAHDVHYPDSLINGDFEFGKLDGWTKSGDGRVITRLGGQAPTGGSYMGIISTGLGFTTATGSIFQTFTIKSNQTKLTVKWNFLSEEFLEYIGSQYQDYFRVVVKDKNGTETVLLNKTIDILAASFGATKTSPGTLISVSPGITFDEGGVYMTGWQTSELDVSAFAGKRVTLIIRAGDVGDSVYDTAILIDDVSVH